MIRICQAVLILPYLIYWFGTVETHFRHTAHGKMLCFRKIRNFIEKIA